MWRHFNFIAIYAVLLLNLLFTLFCRQIFSTIYALSCGEKMSPKVHLWRKMTNIRSGCRGPSVRLGQCQTSKTFTSPSTNLNLGGGRVEVLLFVGIDLENTVIGSWAMIITENQHKIANL